MHGAAGNADGDQGLLWPREVAELCGVGSETVRRWARLGLIEYVRTLTTSDETLETARSFGESLGKRIIVSKDRAGFIVNFLLIPYLTESIRMLEQGFASKEDIDVGMMLGTSYPMGPFTLLDFVGLDTTLYIADVLFDEFKESRFAAPTLLRQMVAAGYLGRKTGRGFYNYQAGERPPSG